MKIDDVLDLPDGLWCVAKFCEEPNTGLVVLRGVEPTRAVSIIAPISWVEALLPTPPEACAACGEIDTVTHCGKCGAER